MGSASKRPVVTEEAKASIAARYAAGESLAELRAAFRIWTSDLKWAIKKHRVPLRPEDEAEKRCRVCGAKVLSSTLRSLCAAHVRRFCSRCEDELPQGRANRWCAACDAAHKEAILARPARLCTLCGKKPATLRSFRCADCLRKVYWDERQVLLKQQRSCRDCQASMPPGRRNPRCSACMARHRRQLLQARRRRGEHRCLLCGDKMRLKEKSYCAGCNTMIVNWRKAWHEGNPVARRLGTVEKRTRWQQ